MNRGRQAHGGAAIRQQLGEASFLSDRLGQLLRSLDTESVRTSPTGEKPTPAGPSKAFADEFPRILYNLRRARDLFFPGVFAEPGWDILLDLYHWQRRGQATSSSSCCLAAAVPATTALRHISLLVDHGLVRRKKDPADGRLVLLELTDAGVDAIEHWLRLAESSLAAPELERPE